VFVAGSFNNWTQILMTKTMSSLFRISVTLKPGTHYYKFVVRDDRGGNHWCYDASRPCADDGNGNWNNVITVPQDGKQKKDQFYITTAINYTNGSPHFGHAYEVIAADTIARYHRITGKRVFYDWN